MRNALRMLCAAAGLLVPVAADAQYSYRASYYQPFPPPIGYQPPATPFFYAPPIAYVGGYGGGFGGCGQSYGVSCSQAAPVRYRQQAACCQPYGYGQSYGYGYGQSYAQSYGYQPQPYSYGYAPGYVQPHLVPPPRRRPPPIKLSAQPADSPRAQAVAAHYAAYGYYYPPQQPALTRIAPAPHPKPTGLRGATKPLPLLKPVADASAMTE